MDEPLSPGPGCDVEELRVWAHRQIVKLDATVQGLLREQKAALVREELHVKVGEKLRHIEDRINVVEQKDVEKHQALETLNKQLHESGAINERQARDYAMGLHETRAEMSKFASNLEASRA